MKSIKLIIVLFALNTVALSAQVSFADPVVINGHTIAIKALFSSDIDGDGDFDVLSASEDDNKIAWYENIDGFGTFSPQRLITTAALSPRSVFACDIDGDGDQDVLSASEDDDKIAWYENEDGNGNFGVQKVITDTADGAAVVYACDLDGDGDMDVIYASHDNNKLVWLKNIDGFGNFELGKVISHSIYGQKVIFGCDIDYDGDLDLLIGSDDNAVVRWWENLNGDGSSFDYHTITYGNPTARGSVFPYDINNDGYIDIITTASLANNISIYYNDGSGIFSWAANHISFSAFETPVDILVTDIDGDSLADVICTCPSDKLIYWFRNKDGYNFESRKILTDSIIGPWYLFSSDFNGDGYQDILTSSAYNDNQIIWIKNYNSGANFEIQQYITTCARGAQYVIAADIDNDGDMDVMSASWQDGKVAWYENLDGVGMFGSEIIISSSLRDVRCVFPCDIDGDGDQDILTSSPIYNLVVWFENTDGEGTFGAQQIISDTAGRVLSLFAVDLDNDMDVDVITADYDGDLLVWYENIDGMGNFSSQKIISNSAHAVNPIASYDFDGDGDYDILCASAGDDKIVWYENTDGAGLFGSAKIITSEVDNPNCIYACDIDGDNDFDVLSSSFHDGKIAWYENLDGMGSFGPQQLINDSTIVPRFVHACDIDLDGDMDALSMQEVNNLYWYENTDGNGNFGLPQLISSDNLGTRSIYTCDVNNDGDYDILTAVSHKITWIENLTIISVPHISKKTISIYPNPTKGKIYFDIGKNEIEIIKIYDLNGKLVLETSNLQTVGSLDISTYRSGVYIISIQTEKEIYSGKFVKE